MLPKVDWDRWVRCRNSNYGRNSYSTFYVRSLINIDADADVCGYTNNTGMKLVGDINAYLIESASVMYTLHLAKALINRRESIGSNYPYKIIKGLAAQRGMARSIRYKVKHNPVDKYQDVVLRWQLNKLNERLVYLTKLYIPVLLEETELIYYQTYLDEHNLSLRDDIEPKFDNWTFLDEYPEQLEEISVYVKQIIDNMKDRKDIAKRLEANKKRRILHQEQQAEEAKKYKEREMEKMKGDAISSLDALSSRAQKIVLRTGKRFPDRTCYVCAAVRIQTSKNGKPTIGFVKSGSHRRKMITADPDGIVLYRSEEEAIAAGEQLKSESVREVIYNVVPVFKEVI